MAKKQKRRSVSLGATAHQQLTAYAVKHKIPASQIVEQAIAALLDGRLVLKPPIVYATIDQRGPTTAARRTGIVQLAVRDRKSYPAATCACCIAWIPAGTDVPILAPWGRDDAPVRICPACYGLGQRVAL